MSEIRKQFEEAFPNTGFKYDEKSNRYELKYVSMNHSFDEVWDAAVPRNEKWQGYQQGVKDTASKVFAELRTMQESQKENGFELWEELELIIDRFEQELGEKS